VLELCAPFDEEQTMRTAIAFSLVVLLSSACGSASEAPAVDRPAASQAANSASAATPSNPSNASAPSNVTVDAGRWTLAGPVKIIATFSSDWVSRQTSPLGPCNHHYTDDAEAKGPASSMAAWRSATTSSGSPSNCRASTAAR